MGIGAPIHKDDVLSDLDYVAGSIGIAADGRSSAAGRSADVVIALLTIFMRLPSNRYSPPDNRDRASPETPHHGVPTMTLSLRRSALVSAACLVGLLCLASGSVLATADGPDFYRVVDVGATSALNIRAKPGTDGAVVGRIPADADGIANFGCSGGLTLAEYEAASAAERAAARKTRWCKVGYDRTVGWAAGWFLAEGGSEDGFRGGAALGSLAGSEWLLRDFAGQAAQAKAWMAFKADGVVSGLGGCNQFNGGYTDGVGSLRFGPLASTRMACPEPQMTAETELFKALDATREIVATHLVLALFDETGTLLATLTRRDAD